LHAAVLHEAGIAQAGYCVRRRDYAGRVFVRSPAVTQQKNAGAEGRSGVFPVQVADVLLILRAPQERIFAGACAPVDKLVAV